MSYPSPFHERLIALNETWKYKDWAGILAPCRYIENHIYEYTAFRQSTGVLDVTPLYKYELRGKDAALFLSRVTSKDVSKLKPGLIQIRLSLHNLSGALGGVRLYQRFFLVELV